MYYIRIILRSIKASTQQEMAYSFNFFIHLLYSLLNLGIGMAALGILFDQVESIRGWNYSSTLALLGIFLIVSSVRGLFIGPSLEALAGMDGEIMTGKFDFTCLRPINLQFLSTFRYWQPFALLDLSLGIAVLIRAILLPDSHINSINFLLFTVTLAAGLLVMYAILLAFSSLVFWSPGFMFTWVFDGLFQLARYPVGLYPGWTRALLTWVIPVGVITTIPAKALSGNVSLGDMILSISLALGLFIITSSLFKFSVKRYTRASS